jgi:hypothetical protein
MNSVGHLLWAAYEWDYVPGAATAPVLFILAVYLSLQLFRQNWLDEFRSESGKVRK